MKTFRISARDCIEPIELEIILSVAQGAQRGCVNIYCPEVGKEFYQTTMVDCATAKSIENQDERGIELVESMVLSFMESSLALDCPAITYEPDAFGKPYRTL